MKKTAIFLALILLLLCLSACGEAPKAEETIPEPAATAEEPLADPAPEKDPEPETPATPETPSEPETEPEKEPEPPAEPATENEPEEAPPVPIEETVPPAEPEQPVEPEPPAKPEKDDAKAFVGKSVELLYEAIGEPNGSAYAGSCSGSGDDGELYYDGFVVYTYRENGAETVTAVA